MKLELMMKRPVVFPDLDPKVVLSGKACETEAQAWQAYAEAMLEGNEPCMEMSESAEEIVSFIDSDAELNIERLDRNNFRISGRSSSIVLCEESDGMISLRFGKENRGIDVTDFSPEDVALFIKAIFVSYPKVAYAIC